MPASVRGFNLKNHEELKKNSQLIEKWHRFSLGVCEKSHTPGTDRVKSERETEIKKKSVSQTVKYQYIGTEYSTFFHFCIGLKFVESWMGPFFHIPFFHTRKSQTTTI